MFKKYMCLALCLLLALGTMTTTASAASLAVDGLVVSHVSFADANGPVTDLPETASSVTASVTVSNNSAASSSVVLAMGKFVDDVLVDIKYDQKTLTANEQDVAFSATLDNVAKDEVTKDDGTVYDRTVLKAFVWTKLVGGKALAAPATLPSDDTSFVFVTKNGVIWDGFDASATEQELVLPRTEGVPSIKFFPNDNATKIEEPAKFALGTNTVKVTSAQGTEKTYNINLRYEDPAAPTIEMGVVNGATAAPVTYINEPFGPDSRPFSDRLQWTNAWVGEGLLGGNYFRTSARDDKTIPVQNGIGTYFSFTPSNASGTVYVVYKEKIDRYLNLGWTLVNDTPPTWVEGSNVKTPYDQPTDRPYFAGYIQWRNESCIGQQFDADGNVATGPDFNEPDKTVNNAQYPNPYQYVYSKKFTMGEKVDIPTIGKYAKGGSNVFVVVKWDNPNPDLSSDSTLKSLTYATDGAAQTVPGFNNTQSGKITYDKIVLAEGTTSVTVNAEANDAKATVSIDGAAATSKVVDLTSGSATVVVSVRPEDPAIAASTFTIPFEVEGSTPPAPESDAILLDESNGALKSATPKATIGTILLETTAQDTYEYVKGVALETISDRTQEYVINGDGKNYGYTWTLSSADYKPGTYDVYVKGTSMGSNGADSFFIVYNEQKIDNAGGNMFKAPVSTAGDPLQNVATREHIELNWVKGATQVVIPENGSYTLRVTGRENPFVDKVILIPTGSDLTIDTAEAELCKEYTATFAVDGATVATVLYDDSVVGTAVPTKGWVLNTETNRAEYIDVPALVIPEKEGFTAAWAPKTLQANGTAFVADYKADVTALFEDDFQGYTDGKMNNSKWKTDYASKYSRVVKEADGNQYVSLFAVHTETEDQHYPRLWINGIPMTTEQMAQPIHISGRVQPVNDVVKPSFSLELRKSASAKAVVLNISNDALKLFDVTVGSIVPGNWVTFDLYVTLGQAGQDSEFTVVYTGNGLKNMAGLPANKLVATGKKNVDVVGITDSLPIMFNTSIGVEKTEADNACVNIDDVLVYNDTVPTFSSNAKLSALTYAPNGSNPTAVPGFSAANEGGTYTVDLNAGTTSVTLGATTADTKATKTVLVNGQVVENGVVTISGATTAVVSVVAEDGTKNDFTVKFTVEGVGEQNKIQDLKVSADSANAVYDKNNGYNLGEFAWNNPPKKVIIEDGIKLGDKSDANATQKYTDRDNSDRPMLAKDYDSYFAGATIIRRPKGDGGSATDVHAGNKKYFTANRNDGKDGRGYWMEFTVSSDCTVFTSGSFQRTWPNKPADWTETTRDYLLFDGQPTVYYKEYKAGDKVQIPSFGYDDAWASDNEWFDPPIYVVVWDSEGKTNPDKNRSNDTKLSALTYKVGDNAAATVTGFNPADAAPKTYNVWLEENTTSVTLSATRANQTYGNTVITVDGVEKTDGVIAVSGDAPTTAVVTVKAHDGTTTGEYSVTFTVGGEAPVLSTNTKLSALTYAPNGTNVTAVPGFSAADAGKTYDKITLAAGTTSVTVGATVADTGKASYAVKVGTDVKTGGVVPVSSAADTTVNVVVTAEDTTVTDTYTLVFAVTPDAPAPSNTISDMTYWNKSEADLPKVVDIVRGTTQAYGSAVGVEIHSITSEEFDVAGSVIQRVKGEAGTPTSTQPFYAGAYDGQGTNPYWMTFKMNAPGTVYVVDMEGKGWPNKGDWAVDTTGITFGLWGVPYNMASGRLYSKHFNAGETVEVPNYGWDSSWGDASARIFTNPDIYLILWDSALPKSASLKSLTYTEGSEEAETVTGFVSGSPSGTYNVGVTSTEVKIAAEAITNSGAEVTFSSNVAADGTITFVDGAAKVVVTVKSADKSKTNTYTVNFSIDQMFGATTYEVPKRTSTKIDILVNPDLIKLRANSGNNEIKPVDPLDNFSKLYGDRGAGLPGSGSDKIGMSFIDVGAAIKGATHIIDPIQDTRAAAIRDGFTSKDNEYFRFRATEKGTVYVKFQGNIASYDNDKSWTKVVEAGVTPNGINDWKGNGIPEDYVHNTTQYPYYFNLYQNATTDATPANYHTKYTTTYYKTFEAGEIVSIRTIASTANQNLITLIQWGENTTSYDSSLKSLTYNGVSVPNFKATEARYTIYSTTTDPVAIAAAANDGIAAVNIDKPNLTPSAEGNMATITVTSSLGTTRYYVTAKLTTEENKIVNFSTASTYGIYGTDGYNTDKTKQTDKYTIEDDLDIGTPADGDTPAVNGDFGYNDRNNVRYTSDTSSFFKGATYIRTSKNDTGDFPSKKPYFSGNFDGKNGNPYWVEFVVTSDATVYFADTYYWNDHTSKNPAVQAYATPWPNKPADWLVAQPTDDLAIHGTAFHGTPESESVYYKHYNAGEVVQIPCYGMPSAWPNTGAESEKRYDPPVYLIVWDSDINTNPDGGIDDGGNL